MWSIHEQICKFLRHNRFPYAIWFLRIRSGHSKMPRAWAVEIHAGRYKQQRLSWKMPRACPVEPHVGRFCSYEREAPRDKPVASFAVWPNLIIKDHTAYGNAL